MTGTSEAAPVRPTPRCLREDQASKQFADPDTPHERIRAIDDAVFFKVKAGRWRGAVFGDAPDSEVRDWLVADGVREEGSKDDFYASLYGQARTARQYFNAEHQAWSNLMDPKAAARLLDDQSPASPPPS